MPRKKKGRPTYGTKKKERGYAHCKRPKVTVFPDTDTDTDTNGGDIGEPIQIQVDQSSANTSSIGNDDVPCRQRTAGNDDRQSASTSQIDEQASSSTSWGKAERLRQSIAYCYIEQLQMPDKEEWSSSSGTIHQILKKLDLLPSTHYQLVRRVLEGIIFCGDHNIEYTGEREIRKQNTNLLLPDGCVEMQIIADHMEIGLGLRQTLEIVNEHRKQSGKSDICLYTLHQAYLRLEPVIRPIQRSKQGSCDPKSAWAIAQKNQSRQLLIRFGVDGDHFYFEEGVAIPDYFDPDKMTTLTLEQVFFWDETHKKVYVGFQGANGSNTQCCFRRDANGALDSEGELILFPAYVLQL
jgi:hypothetical protein